MATEYVLYKGYKFSSVAAESLAEVDNNLAQVFKISLNIIQGGFNPGGVEASGAVHDKDAIDVSTIYLSDVQIAGTVVTLRMCGWAAWYRPPNWDGVGGAEHIHAVPNRWGMLSTAAYNQTTQYRAGTNGLVSRGPDNQLGSTSRYRLMTWADYKESDTMTQADFTTKLLTALNDRHVQEAFMKLSQGATYGLDLNEDGKRDTVGQMIARMAKQMDDMAEKMDYLDKLARSE